MRRRWCGYETGRRVGSVSQEITRGRLVFDRVLDRLLGGEPMSTEQRDCDPRVLDQDERLSVPGAGRVLLVLAVMIAVGLGLASCASHRSLDLIGRDEVVAADAAPGSLRPDQAGSETVQATLEALLGLFDDFRPEAIAAKATGIYHEDAYFNDGFVEVTGAQAIAEYLGRTADATKTLDISLEDSIVLGDEAYLRWIMRFTTSGRRAVSVVAPGITHLRLDAEGRIIYHRDYWDAGTAVAEFVPVAGGILRAVRSRL